MKGFDTRIDLLNLFYGVLGAGFAGLSYITIRKIGKSEHPIVIVNYFMLSAGILAGLVMISFWQTPTLKELILLLATGIIGFYAQLYMTKSFQLEAASKVVQFAYIELVYSLIFGLVFFGEGYSLLAFLGILIILISMMMNVILKDT